MTPDSNSLMASVIAPENFKAAWQWLKKSREASHPNNDYWDLRFHRDDVEPDLIHKLRTGCYQFSPCRVVKGGIVWREVVPQNWTDP